MLKNRWNAIALRMYLPERHRQNLVEAHSECAKIIASSGHVPEPIEVALLAEEHRWFWRPEEVRFMLVAESHVYTTKDETEVKIVPSRLPRETPKSIPRNFVKLVYCFGYGEPSVLDHPERIESNPGTKQYDNLFSMCAGLDEKPTGLGKVRWKVKVLNALKKRGFWLLDASCHACYLGNGKRLQNDIVSRIVPISWRRYVKPVVKEALTDKKRVWIIGKGLQDMLRAKDGFVSGLKWIYQPNVRFRNPEKYHEKDIREQQLKRAIGHYCLGREGASADLEAGDTTAKARSLNDYTMEDGGHIISERQEQFAKFVDELKQKGIKGEEYRERIAQWNRGHKGK